MATQGFNIRFNGIIGFVFMVLIFVGLFFIAKGVFTVLAWIAPVLIILCVADQLQDGIELPEIYAGPAATQSAGRDHRDPPEFLWISDSCRGIVW